MAMVNVNADLLIKHIKDSSDMPLSKICKLMDVSESTFANVQKRGKINTQLLHKLCDVFGLRAENYQMAQVGEESITTEVMRIDCHEDLKEIKNLLIRHCNSTSLLLDEICKVLKELTYGTKEE